MSFFFFSCICYFPSRSFSSYKLFRYRFLTSFSLTYLCFYLPLRLKLFILSASNLPSYISSLSIFRLTFLSLSTLFLSFFHLFHNSLLSSISYHMFRFPYWFVPLSFLSLFNTLPYFTVSFLHQLRSFTVNQPLFFLELSVWSVFFLFFYISFLLSLTVSTSLYLFHSFPFFSFHFDSSFLVVTFPFLRFVLFLFPLSFPFSSLYCLSQLISSFSPSG